MEAMHLQQQLLIVSKSLNIMQGDDCTLGDVVHVWLGLLEAPILQPYKDVIQKRFNQCITPLHLVAYQWHPKYRGVNLNADQDENASQWLHNVDPTYLTSLLSFNIDDTTLYPKSLMMPSVRNSLKPSKWWQVLEKKLEKANTVSVDTSTLSLPTPEFCRFMSKISSLPASSASVERLFSTFGRVHTKLRNRLGNEKVEKLVFCNQALRDQNSKFDDW